MTRFRRSLLPVALLFGASLSGCGGGATSSTSSAPEGTEASTSEASADVGDAAPSTGSAPGFEDVTAESGVDFFMSFLPNEQGGANFKVNLYDHGSGVVVADFDADGRDDLYFLNQLGANGLYRNTGGAFEDVTERAGVGLGDRISVGGAAADIDGDGDQDLFVTSTRGGNTLFRNDGDLRFVDVTEEAGVALVAHSQTAAFFDADLDGDLDLFVTNSAEWTTDDFDEQSDYYKGAGSLWELILSELEFNRYYRNDGDGTFTEATEESGLRGLGWGGDVAIADYDRDGDSDLLVTNMFGRSQLYRNDGEASFIEVTESVLGRISWGAIGSRWFDLNNDARLDLYIVDMHSDMWMPPDDSPERIEEGVRYARILGPLYGKTISATQAEERFADDYGVAYDEVLFGNSLFVNRGEGRFDEVATEAGAETFWPWGIATGDFDNDGRQDVFLPSGMGYPYFYWRNALLMNQGDGTFVDRGAEAGIEPPANGRLVRVEHTPKDVPRSSRCAATGDFDGDGRLDLVVNNFNDAPYLYRNVSPKRSWVAFDLVGTASNRDAIGAVVEIPGDSETLMRSVQTAGGYLSQSSKTLHFGLGDRDRLEKVVIHWPSGLRQELEDLEANRLHTIEEPPLG